MNIVLNRHLLAALCATPLLLSMGLAHADEAIVVPTATAAAAPAEPVPAYTLTYNLGMYSSYMFRGVDYSNGPALQGGIDWAHSSGFYLGTWFSNLDPYAYGQVDGTSKGDHLETDFYAGYAHTFDNGFGVNFLGNYYKYLEGRKSADGHKQDSFEVSAAVSYKYFTYTYYNLLTDYYGLKSTPGGTGDSKNTQYHELKVNYKLPVGDLNFMAKVGYQRSPDIDYAVGGLKHNAGSEGDYAIGLNRDFSLPSGGKPITGFNAGGYYTNTFAVKDQNFWLTNDGRDTNQQKLWFYVKRSW